MATRADEGVPGVTVDGEVIAAFPFFDGSFAEALAAAAAADKLLFVDVGAYWCDSCHLLEEQVFTLPEVGAAITADFIAYRVDAERDEGPELAERYRIQAFPTLLVLDSHGLERGRLVEVSDAATLLAGLRAIARGGDPLAELAAAAIAAPDDLEARYRYALALALAARRDAAAKAYDDLLRDDPDNAAGFAAKALYNRATFITANLDGDLEGAIAGYRELQRRFPASPEATRAYRSIGRLLHRLGRSDQAIASLEAMVASDPTNIGLKASSGWFSFRQRCHPEVGLRIVEAGLVQDPEHAELHYLRAELQTLVGDREGAAASIRRAAAREPSNAFFRRQQRRFTAAAAASAEAGIPQP